MSLSVRIQKRLGDFLLQADFTAGDEPLALLGASGCGKSVTLRCIAGILRPDEGVITLDGHTLFDSAAHIDLPPQKRNVGYLFQQYALFPNMTVRQNITAAVVDRRRRKAVTEEQLRRFRLEDVAEQKPRQLSGGQQQRAALARILASSPGAILLDEPFSALDSYLKYQLELELQDTLSQFAGPVIWVTHDRGEARRSCRRVCVMDQGATQGVTAMEDLFRRPATWAAARLSGCENFTQAHPEDCSVRLPAWGVTLTCGAPIPADIRWAGIRAAALHPASAGEENAFPCTVVRTVEDVEETILLLRPTGATADTVPLRMALSHSAPFPDPSSASLYVAAAPEDILLLR